MSQPRFRGKGPSQRGPTYASLYSLEPRRLVERSRTQTVETPRSQNANLQDEGLESSTALKGYSIGVPLQLHFDLHSLLLDRNPDKNPDHGILYVAVAVSLSSFLLAVASLVILAAHPNSCDCQRLSLDQRLPPDSHQSHQEQTNYPSRSAQAESTFKHSAFYGAKLYPSLESHVYVPVDNETDSSPIFPAAVFYGDIVVVGGNITHINVPSPPPPPQNTSWLEMYRNERSRHSETWKSARDRFNTSERTGKCGIGLLHRGLVEYVSASGQNCTLDAFLIEREDCCWHPELCRSPASSVCQAYNKPGLTHACRAASCCVPSGSNEHCVQCPSKKCKWSRRRERNSNATSFHAELAQRQATIYKSDPPRRPLVDRPFYYLQENKIIHPGGLIYTLVRLENGAFLSAHLNRGQTPHEASSSFTTARKGNALPLHITVHNDPVNVTQHDVFALQVSFSHFEKNPDSFQGTIASLNETGASLRNTVESQRLDLHVITQGLIPYTFLVDVNDEPFVITPVQYFRIGASQNINLDPPACTSIVNDAVSCFKQKGADRDLCTSRAQTDRVRNCCNTAVTYHLYIECLE